MWMDSKGVLWIDIINLFDTFSVHFFFVIEILIQMTAFTTAIYEIFDTMAGSCEGLILA